MLKGSVFMDDQAQTVSLPDEARFPSDVKQVAIRIIGKDRILSPADKSWTAFSYLKTV